MEMIKNTLKKYTFSVILLVLELIFVFLKQNFSNEMITSLAEGTKYLLAFVILTESLSVYLYHRYIGIVISLILACFAKKIGLDSDIIQIVAVLAAVYRTIIDNKIKFSEYISKNFVIFVAVIATLFMGMRALTEIIKVFNNFEMWREIYKIVIFILLTNVYSMKDGKEESLDFIKKIATYFTIFFMISVILIPLFKEKFEFLYTGIYFIYTAIYIIFMSFSKSITQEKGVIKIISKIADYLLYIIPIIIIIKAFNGYTLLINDYINLVNIILMIILYNIKEGKFFKHFLVILIITTTINLFVDYNDKNNKVKHSQNIRSEISTIWNEDEKIEEPEKTKVMDLLDELGNDASVEDLPENISKENKKSFWLEYYTERCMACRVK